MIEAKFKFHPVGQGGFYSGKFYNDEVVIASVVYDCGTITRNNFIREEIEEFKSDIVSNEKEISLLVISHFDEDHINHLTDLLTNITRVQYIIVPYINKIEKLCLIMKHLNDTSDFGYREFVWNTVKWFDDQGINIEHFLFVNSSDRNQGKDKYTIALDDEKVSCKINKVKNDDVYAMWEDVIRNRHDDTVEAKRALGVKNVCSCDDKIKLEIAAIWQFMFYVKRPSKKIEDIMELHKGIFAERNMGLFDILRDESRLAYIRNCYKLVCRNLNYTSLVLYHKPIKVDNFQPHGYIRFNLLRLHGSNKVTRRIASNIPSYCYAYKSATLLLGDSMLKPKAKQYRKLITDIAKHFLEIQGIKNVTNQANIDDILVATVPHHGAASSWCTHLMVVFKSCFWCFLSGVKNKYEHPKFQVVEDVVKNKKTISVWVNDYRDTGFSYQFQETESHK